MNAETFCEHFATLADAPNGVEKLRAMILQLAVQGNLVPQDPNDEPPESVLVGEVVDFLGGYAFKSEWFQDRPGIRLVRNQNIGHGNLDWSDTEYLPEERVGAFSKFELHPGDLVLSLNRPFISTGLKLAWITAADCPCLLVQRVACLRPIRDRLLPEFLYLWCNAPHFYRDAHVVPSSGVPYIATNRVEKMAMRLPPLAEQRRIVEKVDQLLGLCDELAARQAAQREKRQRLVGATLDRLVSTRNPAEFPTHAHRLRNHFDQLFDTPTTIPQLRQTILQLAVQGQLVPQDPDDEPASKIVSTLADEWTTLAEKMKIRSRDAAGRVNQNEFPFDVPLSWQWAKLGCLGITQTGSTPPTQDATNFGNHIPFVKPGDISPTGIDYSNEGLSESGIQNGRLLLAGSVLMVCIGGSMGKAAIIDRDVSCNQQINGITPVKSVNGDFLLIAIRSRYFQQLVQSRAGQGTLPILSKSKWDQIPIPLPPLAEQKRIVTKVTELLSLCDALEAKLTQAESASTQLLSAAVHHLFNTTI